MSVSRVRDRRNEFEVYAYPVLARNLHMWESYEGYEFPIPLKPDFEMDNGRYRDALIEALWTFWFNGIERAS